MNIHKHNASKLFDVPYESVTPQQRRVAKLWFHASHYSSGEIKLGLTVGQYPIKFEAANEYP